MSDDSDKRGLRIVLVVLGIASFVGAAWLGTVVMDIVETGGSGLLLLGPVVLLLAGWGFIIYSGLVVREKGNPLDDADDGDDAG